MSVLKNKRGESGAEFLNVADKLEIFTIEQCSKAPRRFNHTLIDRIINLSIDCHCCLKSANSIYPRNQHEAQNRRDILQTALNCIENMGSQIHILQCVTNTYNENKIEEWSNLLEYEQRLVRGLMRKDAERYGKLL